MIKYNTKQIHALICVFLIGLFAAVENSLAVTLEKKWPVHLRILTSPIGGQWNTLGEKLAKALLTHIPASSYVGFGIKNISDVNKRSGDLAFTLTCFLKSTQPKEAAQLLDTPPGNVALLANLYPQVLYIVLRKDFADQHKITSFQSFLQIKKPVKFATLKPGSTSELILQLLLHHGYGTSFEKLREMGWKIHFTSFLDLADELASGNLDGFAYTAGVNASLIHDLAAHTPIVLLPIQPERLKILQHKFNTTVYIINADQYPHIGYDVTTLSDYACIIVRKDLPDDLVELITTTLWEKREEIGHDISDLKYLTPQTAVSEGIFVHPGAAKVWEKLREQPLH